MKPKYLILSFCLFLTAVFLAAGQTKTKINSVYYTIPRLVADAPGIVKSTLLEDSMMMVNHVYKPISSSPHYFEARCFFRTVGVLLHYDMVILKGNRHSLTTEIFHGVRAAIVMNGTKGIQLDDRIKLGYDYQKYSIGKNDSLLNQLINYGLFTLPDSQTRHTALQPGNVGPEKVHMLGVTFFSDVIFEVKLGKEYHCFRFNRNLLDKEPQNRQLQAANQLLNVFLRAVNLQVKNLNRMYL